MADAPLMSVRGLVKSYDIRKGVFERLWSRGAHLVRALNDVDFDIARGETLGLIGESGCGKSTLARVVLQLQRATAGAVMYDGTDLTRLSHSALRAYRRRMQIVFQDPFAALNPRHTTEQIVGLPLRIHEPRMGARARRDRVASMLERVGLRAAYLTRYPHQFSGGQRQRISIARALVAHPELVVCDEAVSALDASIQAQILRLLADLRRDLGLTYLFISHNIAVVGQVSDRIAVMYLGRIVEIGPARDLLSEPKHPYTRMLIASVPRVDGGAVPEGPSEPQDPPSPLRPPPGCAFHPRCPLADGVCREVVPALRTLADGRTVACHLAR